MPTDEKLLTVEEMAIVLQMNPRTVIKYAKAKSIPAVRIGRTFRFHLPTVLAKYSK